MIVKVTQHGSEKHTERISDDQSRHDQQYLIDAGMVIARSNAFQIELLCKRTGHRTVFTDAALFSPIEQPA